MNSLHECPTDGTVLGGVEDVLAPLLAERFATVSISFEAEPMPGVPGDAWVSDKERDRAIGHAGIWYISWIADGTAHYRAASSLNAVLKAVSNVSRT